MCNYVQYRANVIRPSFDDQGFSYQATKRTALSTIKNYMKMIADHSLWVSWFGCKLHITVESAYI